MPSIFREIGISQERFLLNEDAIDYLIEAYSPHPSGIRNLNKTLEVLFKRINLLQLPNEIELAYKKANIDFSKEKIIITRQHIQTLLFDSPIAHNVKNTSLNMMYM